MPARSGRHRHLEEELIRIAVDRSTSDLAPKHRQAHLRARHQVQLAEPSMETDADVWRRRSAERKHRPVVGRIAEAMPCQRLCERAAWHAARVDHPEFGQIRSSDLDHRQAAIGADADLGGKLAGQILERKLLRAPGHRCRRLACVGTFADRIVERESASGTGCSAQHWRSSLRPSKKDGGACPHSQS